MKNRCFKTVFAIFAAFFIFNTFFVSCAIDNDDNDPKADTPTTYTITYNLNGGTNPTEAKTQFTSENAVTLPTPTREGYTFDGWFEAQNFSGSAISSWAAGTKNANVTLYAKWTENPSNTNPDPNPDPDPEQTPEPGEEISGKTAAWIIENMGAGWNLGNTLDANDETPNSNPDTETLWGMPETTEAMIEAVAKAGFKHVRVPVSWHNHYDASTKKIDTTWLSRVKTIVDWCLKYNMFVVINIHHDTWNGTSDFYGYSVDGTHEEESTAFVQNIWTEVATYFKNYDQRLVFETLNEPRLRGTAHEWYCTDYISGSGCATCLAAVNRINSLNKTALDKIRAAGEKNADRVVIVPPYVASPQFGFKDDFKIPTDSVSNRLAVSVHMYTPDKFAFAPTDSVTEFDDSCKNDLDWHFATLKEKFIDKGYPVFIGEFSATNKNNSAERIKWATYYVGKAAENKIACCLWDNMKYTNSEDSGEAHGHFDRTTLTWWESDLIKAITGYTPGTAPVTPAPTKTAIDLTAISSEATEYSIEKTASSATISHSVALSGWKNFNFQFTAGKENLEMKIKNNSTSNAADIRIDLMEGWTTDAIKSAKVNGTAVNLTTEDSGKTYLKYSISAGTEISLKFTMDSTASVFMCFYDSMNVNPTSGIITINEAYMY